MSQTQDPPGPSSQAPVAAPSGQQAPAYVQEAPTRPGNPRRLLLINGIGLLVLIIIGLVAFYLWHQSYYFYNTDDALVSGPIAAVAPPAPGTVTSVSRRLGDTVRQGQSIATLRTATDQTMRLTSPINGTIINEGATPGEVLPAGQPLAQVVNLSTLGITAYVEETHLNDVKVNQGVDVKVDAVGDDTLHGTVAQISPATASATSALPTSDRGTGNFTKVTQRIPVQIRLDGYQGHTLYPGESASVTIHIHS